jgi:hypothetical protein
MQKSLRGKGGLGSYNWIYYTDGGEEDECTVYYSVASANHVTLFGCGCGDADKTHLSSMQPTNRTILSFLASPRPRCRIPLWSFGAFRSYQLHTPFQAISLRKQTHKRTPPYHFSPANQLPISIPHTSNMSDQSGPSQLHWQVLFEAALQDYEKQTGIVLANNPLAQQLQACDSAESVTAVLLEQEQTQAFSEFRERDKILKSLKNAVSVLHKLSATTDLGQAIGLVCLYTLIWCLTFLTPIL